MKTISIRPKSWVVMAYLVFLALAIWACYALLHAAWSWEPGFSLHNLFFGLFLVAPFLFGIAVVGAMILLKKITFAAEEILIAYPLIFYRKSIDLEAVSEVRIKPYNISSRRNGTVTTYYRGEELVFYRKSKRVLKVNSFEYKGFADLKHVLADKIKASKPIR